MEEIWKPVVGYEGLYEVSNKGRVKSLNYRSKGMPSTLSLGKIKSGYFIVNLWKDKVKQCLRVHRLVACAFLCNSCDFPEVLHKDNNPGNNNIENLMWGTHQDNMDQMNNEGRGVYKSNHPCKGKFGIHHHRSKVVSQFTIEGDFIKEWGGLADIERELGICNSGTSACCRGKYKKSGGFIWKYKNPIN